MRRVVTALCLAFLAATFVACGGKVNPPGPPGGPAPGGPPVVISAAQLAQEFFDDTHGAGQRYVGKTLEISGTVGRLERPRGWGKEAGPDDVTASVVFLVPVTHKTTGAKQEYVLSCELEPHLSPAERKAAGLATGKPVTLRGRYEGASIDHRNAKFYKGTVVSAGGQ
jgi:hypothetical protein